MPRNKLTLAYIADDASRKATFKTRKKGLLKKLNELSTLCGIEACAIIYSGYKTEPVVWPSMAEASRAIARFRNKPEMDQTRRMVNQMEFLKQKIKKADEQLRKQRRENRENEVTQVMQHSIAEPGLISLHGLSMLDLNDLDWVIKKTIRDIDEKVMSLNQKPQPPRNNKNNNSNNIGPATNNNIACHANNSDNSGNKEGMASIVDVGDNLAMGTVENQAWYMELMKPSEELMALISGFNDNNSDMNMMALALPTQYPCPSGQDDAASWSNYFFP